MGLIRKAASMSTLGAIDWRSDKERIARSTRKGASAARHGNRLLAKQNRLIAAQGQAEPMVVQQYVMPPAPMGQPAPMPPGWYPDGQVAGLLRWWDGQCWTAHNQPMQPPAPPQYY